MSDSQNDRVIVLEKNVSTLATSVSSLETDVRNVVGSVEKLNDAVASLAHNMQTANKTNWSVLGTWAGVILAVMSTLGYLANQPQVQILQRERETNIRQWDRMESIRAELLKREARIKALEVQKAHLKEKIDAIRSEQLRRTQRVYGKRK